MREIFGIGVVFVLLAACAGADPYGDGPLIGPDGVKPAGTSCGESIEGKDPSGMPECTGTKGVKGRCVARAELGSFATTFETATCKSDAEGCVPDEVIKQGSKIDLKKCTAVLDTEGRCFWPLAKDIVESYDLLKNATKDQCAPDQVCAPCVHPLTKAETGVCNTGGMGGPCDGGAPAPKATCPQVDPILDVASFKAEDCGSNMLCVAAGLAGDLAKSLKKCASGVCAPKKAVERGGNYVPKTCRSTAGGEGRCTNIAVPQVAEQMNILPPGGCDADERCAPCFDPRDGSETGACRTASCDAPKEPAKTFAKCCAGRARCVPTSAVDPEAQSMLATDTCGGDTPLCAPNELIPLPGITPKKCKAAFGLAINGICVAKCAIDVLGAGLVRGDCAEDEMCAPCRLLPNGTCS